MGRIAQALKKAQQERAEKIRLGLGSVPPPRSPAAAVVSETAAAQPECREADRISPARRGLRSLIPSMTMRVAPSSPVPFPTWDVDPSVVVVRDRGGPVTEQYRSVRTWFLRRSSSAVHPCVAITSSVAGEGKSVTVANLAAALAEVRHLNVLAVDADFRKGTLAALFRIPNSPGLADVLAGRATLEDAIKPTPVSNLSILPAGACLNLNPAELINSTASGRVFDEIRERYHFILVDTPPVRQLSDTSVIGALCSGIVVVVRMNKTPSHVVRQAVQGLQANNLNVMGCIASCAGPTGARAGYSVGEAQP